MLKTLAIVKGLGRIVESVGDWATNLKELPRVISPRDEAYARIKTARTEDIGKGYGTRTCMGLEYACGKSPILTRRSRILVPELAKQVVAANKNGKYFHTDSTKEYEESFAIVEEDKRKPLEEKRAIVLPSRTNFEMSLKKNSRVLQFALLEQKNPYYKLNGNFPINFYLVAPREVDSQDGTLLTELWFDRLGNGSNFLGNDGNLDYNDRARGVAPAGADDTAEGSAQKISRELLYTSRELDAQLKNIERIAQGKIKLSDLEREAEKVANFLKKLRQ